MEIISQETVSKVLQGAESAGKVVAGAANELTTEAINFFILVSVLNILKFAAVFVVFYIVKKYLDSLMEANKSLEESDKKAYQDKMSRFKAFKTTALVLSITFFTTQSFPHLIEMGKAMVAPKIFLMEKAAELVKPVVQKQQEK